jgi:energy-coupling factor transporter ATP-binding protein EcfA2
VQGYYSFDTNLLGVSDFFGDIMLKSLTLENFKCFKKYKIDFDKFNLLVGKNNVGKSTVVDALKLISNVTRYARYRDKYLEERDIPFSTINLRHDYSEDPTTITAEFSNDTLVRVNFPFDDKPSAEFFEADIPVSDPQYLREKISGFVGVIPPVGTFEEREKLSTKKYVASITVSHLAPRHFRNIWYFNDEGFDSFSEMVENSWPGYSIKQPELVTNQSELYMWYQENGITRELFWAGHGFQVWLQLMTYLVKLGRVETLVLDEPDIFLHSDLQKKLVSLCKEHANQVIIASHAVDIIEEVEPDDIICIDKDRKKAQKLASIDEVQTLLTGLGSSQNLKLVHFIRGKTCLFVEGKDMKYLKSAATSMNKVFFSREQGFSVIPLEGFSNWDRLMSLEWIFKNALGEKISCYVILDRDYHLDEECQEIIKSLTQKGVNCHIWARKEIENYIIEESLLYRLLKLRYNQRHPRASVPINYQDFCKKLDEIMDHSKNEVISQVTSNAIKFRVNESNHAASVISQSVSEIETSWGDIQFRKNKISGKSFFSGLNGWLNNEYHVTVPIGFAFASLTKDEVNPELSSVINDIIALSSKEHKPNENKKF